MQHEINNRFSLHNSLCSRNYPVPPGDTKLTQSVWTNVTDEFDKIARSCTKTTSFEEDVNQF